MNKKILVALLIGVLLGAVSAMASATQTYYVTSRRLNVRSEAGTDQEIIGTLYYGDKVEVISIYHGWATLYYEGVVAGGFVSARCISKNKPTGNYVSPTATKNEYNSFTAANYYVIVNPANQYVNMRWEASKSAQIRRIYYYGAQLKVIAENGSWCQVVDESTGEVGFILKSLLLRTEGISVNGAENG